MTHDSLVDVLQGKSSLGVPLLADEVGLEVDHMAAEDIAVDFGKRA